MYIYIVYELRNREMDSAILLKNILEKKGHHVEILNKQTILKLGFKNSIIIIPNCYNTINYDYYNYCLNGRNNHIINLQIEQVISEKSENTGFFTPTGKALKAVHCCWGIDTYNRLLENGVPEENLAITGALHLDFLNDQFDDFWYSREFIANKFNIPINKDWTLYISSFSYVNNEAVIEQIKSEFGDSEKSSHISSFVNLSTISQIETLKWFERFLKNNPDEILLYRPHPAETNNPNIELLQSNFPDKFFVMSELNIKQWIKVSDTILTWFSTSIVESFAAKKMCYIVRPYEIPREIDAKIYHGTESIINSYEELENKILNKNGSDQFSHKDFPINLENIERYYNMDNTPAFERTTQLIEKLSTTEKKPLEKNYSLKRASYLLKNNILIKVFIKRLYYALYRKFGIKVTNPLIRKRWALDNIEREAHNFENYFKDEKRKHSIIDSIQGKTL